MNAPSGGDSRLDRAAALLALAAGCLLLLIAAVTSVNAGAFTLDRLARLWGGNVAGLPGYEDFVRLSVSAAALLLLPHCQVRHGHVVVDIFTRNAPRRLRRVLDAAARALTAAFALFLAVSMAIGMAETFQDGALSRVLGWPEWPFYLPGIAALLLWSAVAARQAFAGDADG